MESHRTDASSPQATYRLPVREVEHLLGRLGRYTRFVLFSKWFFGIFALLLMISLIAWPLLSKNHSGMRVSFISSEAPNTPPTQASHPVMQHPEFRGTDTQGFPYRLRGKSATQLSENKVQIDTLQGQMRRQDNGWIMLLSDQAIYDQTAQTLSLLGNVALNDHLTRVFTTTHLTLHPQSSEAETDAPVSISTPDGKILATGLKIRNNGQHLLFGGTGRVTVHLQKMRATK